MTPNGLRLSGARKGVRCSRGLGGVGCRVLAISVESSTAHMPVEKCPHQPVDHPANKEGQCQTPVDISTRASGSYDNIANDGEQAERYRPWQHEPREAFAPYVFPSLAILNHVPLLHTPPNII